MGFLFPKAPKPAPPPNPAMAAPTGNAFADPTPNAGSYIGGLTAQRKTTPKTSLIGGG